MMKTVTLLLFLLFAAPVAYAQSGVLIPSATEKPDPAVLALDEMSLQIVIDNQYARVRVMQIFGNRTERALEGRYVFLIPTTAAISDFAVWDGDVRIPGVILEKRRAEEIYRDLALQRIDPGLLKQEREDGAGTAFTVQVSPIPAYGTKRLELEYTELLRVDNLESYFSFPFKPTEYGTQAVGHLEIRLTILSRFPMSDLNSAGKTYQLNWIENSPQYKSASFEANNAQLTEDFAFSYGLKVPRTSFEFIAYRAPERITADELRDPRLAQGDPDGYFEAAALFNEAGRPPGETEPPPARSVLVLLDTSLSMQWDKLDRAYEATEGLLRSLQPQDSFNLILFNDDVFTFSPTGVDARPDQIDRALNFIKSSYLSGGTDLSAALDQASRFAKAMPARNERAIVMITDGNSTLTTTRTRSIVDRFQKANDAGTRARMYVFGIGADTNIQLLGELARATKGYFDWTRETDDLAFKLKSFTSKIGRRPIESLKLQNLDASNLYHVYPDSEASAYDGARLSFVGRYKRPGPGALTLAGNAAGRPVTLTEQVDFPQLDDKHAHLPRMWARARVDALLRQIALTGETKELIDEIIALSKKYKFVTPYTSFLAAPRSLLRPRVIRPGDPVLRVHADESITEVTAVFPFGLTKRLTYIEGDDVWETRFIAPREMSDGVYHCRLVLVDRQGRAYQEEKNFVIDSRPPTLHAALDQKTVRAGEDLLITVKADSDTRVIAARIFGALPVPVVWDAQAKSSLGRLRIPGGLPSGTYTIQITAEDFAHNSSATEVAVEVIGR
ncbi:MAG TPA: VIT domain-containing protein [Blastocatellia bacterium]|jgi:Ca-activated chloride channel family protein|nr:VIT domain-containing protein [Blastocatellia bacterium]